MTIDPDAIPFGDPLLDATPPWASEPWSRFRDASTEPLRYLVADLWPEGALGFVSAPPKAGKTWVGLALSIAVATGRPLFGTYAIPEPRVVVYIALEGHRSALRARIAALARGVGIDPDGGDLDLLRPLYRPRPFNLANVDLVAPLVHDAYLADAGLVVIDVLRQASRGTRESSADDFAVIRDNLEPLLAERRSVAILHHFGKLTELSKERTPGERMAGSGAMYGALDVGWFITKSEGGARRLRLEVEARDFATPDPIGLALVGTGSGAYGGFAYADTATFEVDATIVVERDRVGQLDALFADEKWRTSPNASVTSATTRTKSGPRLGVIPSGSFG